MNSWHLQSDRFRLTLCFLTLLMFLMGCGAIGPPIPPEDVGIEAKIRKQQQATTQDKGIASEDPATSVEEETVELPVFYPIGTR
jgi:predicted small lipoprotein YifL